MRGVSCTLPRPTTTMYSPPTATPTPTSPTTTPTTTTTTIQDQRRLQHRPRRRPTRRRRPHILLLSPSPAISHTRLPSHPLPGPTTEDYRPSGRPLRQSESPASQSRTTASPLEMPRAVRALLSSSSSIHVESSLIRRLIVARFNTLLHAYQGPRRWLVWHSATVRLAWHAPSEYATVADAMRAGGKARVGWETAGSGEADEEAVGGGLGGVLQTERARGASLSLTVYSWFF
jgi:hypothetical protein